MNLLNVSITVLFIVLAMAALMTPLLRYVVAGWRAKRMDIMDGLGPQARLAYFGMFCRAEVGHTADTASKAFEALYARWYGRRYFLLPGLIFVGVATSAITIAVLSTLHKIDFIDPRPLFDVPDTAVAAITGAYLWVADDFISRARRLDFAPSDLQWATLRFVIAIPMGYAFASLIPDSAGPFVAFALGAFPMNALIAMLRRFAQKALGIEATAEESSDDIIKLQGVNPAIVSRLSFEDVTTVTQMAYCDPVRLVMRSNLTFNFVTDCMNQAIAWMYLQDQLGLLRPMGMRGAVEIKSLIDDYDAAPGIDPSVQAAHALAVAGLGLMAEKLGQRPESLEITFRQIAEDPYTVFLHAVWT